MSKNNPVYILILILGLSLSSIVFSETTLSNHGIKLSEISSNLNEPWGMTFINDDNLLITEKTGEILRINMKTGEKHSVDHELNFFYYGQGGLLDILYKEGYVSVSYSEVRAQGKSSTSIAGGLYTEEKLIFESIFRTEQTISGGSHFGSHIVINDNY